MARLYPFFRYTLLILWSIFVIAPFLWALSTSFKDDAAVVSGATYIPFVDYQPSLQGWATLFGAAGGVDIRRPYVTSLLLTIVSTAIAVALGSMAAYGLVRFRYGNRRFGNNDITFFFVSQRIMPPAVLAIPYFTLLKSLSLLDSKTGLIIVYVAMLLPLVVWVMTDFFRTLPIEMSEAALLDGCSHFTAFLRIILPNATPGLVVAALFAVIICWNDFFFAFTLTFSQTQTLPVSIVALNSSKVPWWSLSASSLISVLPLAALAFVLERYLMSSTLAGTLK